MDYSSLIVKLFINVFEKEKARFSVESNDIKNAFFGDMKEAYKPNSNWEFQNNSKKVDYNNCAQRCAYLHKYAMLHTGLVCEILQSACRVYSIKQILDQNQLKVCSLGGGPGSDVVALIFVLEELFGLVQCDVTVIDSSKEWQSVFESVISELGSPRYGKSAIAANGFLNYKYLRADLLRLLNADPPVSAAIASADIITMVKFVSAAACSATAGMIWNIFDFMKPGGLLLFIDNAAGGFRENMENEALVCGMESLFHSNHFEYEECKFKRVLYGYTSQSKTKVCVQVWKKPISRKGARQSYFRNEVADFSNAVDIGYAADFSNAADIPNVANFSNVADIVYATDMSHAVDMSHAEDVVDSPREIIQLNSNAEAENNSSWKKCCSIM